MTFGSWVVGRVSSIPSVFRFVGFAKSVAFGRFACTENGLLVIFPSLLPFVAFKFSAFGLVVSEFVATEAVSFFGVLRRVLDLFCLWFCLSRFYFIWWYQSYFIWCSKAVESHFPLQMEYYIVILFVLKIRPVGNFFYMIWHFRVDFFVNKLLSFRTESLFCRFRSTSRNSCSFCVAGSNLSESHSHLAFAIDR